ncbi:MAG: SLC13 family permease [Rikenellaceae bacterium]
MTTSHAILVIISIIAMIVVLARDKMRPGMVLFCTVVVLMVGGVITPTEALSGFSNKGMITVALLFLVSEGVRQTGALNMIIGYIMPSKRSRTSRAMLRMLPPISLISAFLNNTAIVIIFAPMVRKWAHNVKLLPSKFLIPLSYATILGGTCTLIGTSTNLVIHGMMLDYGYEGFSMFELGKVGIFITIVGLAYLIIFGNRLLPGGRGRNKEKMSKAYYYDISITENSRFTGEKLVNCKITKLPGLVVTKLRRNGQILDIVNSEIILENNDTLTLKGNNTSVEELIHANGISLDCLKSLDKSFIKRINNQVEAVIAPRFQGIGKTLKDFDFVRHYGGVVVAVNRLGESITTDLDKHVFKEGDNLVILTDATFIQLWGESSAFYLVTELNEFIPPSGKKGRWTAVALILFMTLGATLGDNIDKTLISLTGHELTYYFPALEGVKLDMFFFASIVMVIMATMNIFPQKKYTKFVSWDILITIASAFAISKAMINSGIAALVAEFVIKISADYGPYAVLAVLYLITNVCTELVTNNAAAALSFPIAIAVSQQLGINPYPLFVAISIAASASFSTPIGYQTNLIVQAIGNYKFRDYIRIGVPLNIIVFLITIFLIPLFWSF